jgi:SAM-dependent methyltransferase
VSNERISARIREEFDEIARLSAAHDSDDRYNEFLARLIPLEASSVIDIGCGLGRLTNTLATSTRKVIGVDLSPEMIARAKSLEDNSNRLGFRCGDFLNMQFAEPAFDAVITVATLHHLPLQVAVDRMIQLVRPGGTLIIHDLRSESNFPERVSSFMAGVANCFRRFFRTGNFLENAELRRAWLSHGASETYLTMAEVKKLAGSFSPAARVYKHWFWRYTIVWQRAPEEV